MERVLVVFKNTKNNWCAICIGLILGGILGFVIHVPSTQSVRRLEGKPLRAPDPQYPLINPLLGYDNAEATNFGSLVSFKDKLSNIVNTEIDANNASKVSVYFRDLKAGQWIGVNENESYTPASLLKVPLMLTYYNLAETKPEILSKKIEFDSSTDLDSNQIIKPSKKLERGEAYTVDDLIDEMIVYSDNDSVQMLFDNVPSATFSKIFKDMDVLLPTDGGARDFISVKSYALFFRVLYGSTYLTQAHSEKALELLAKSEYKDGLVAGVPSDIAVAHKFGEYSLIDPGTKSVTKREFHDCGIIYYPSKPYLLCVMTKGNDLVKLEKTVSDISKMVYIEAQTQFK